MIIFFPLYSPDVRVQLARSTGTLTPMTTRLREDPKFEVFTDSRPALTGESW
jgi:hypothetical protein